MDSPPINPPIVQNCAQTAEAYLQTSDVLTNDQQGSVWLIITSNGGQDGFLFTSGLSPVWIIENINNLAHELGITAQQCATNPDRVEIRSVLAGNDAFVSVQEVQDGSVPIVFAAPRGEKPLFFLLDHGVEAVFADLDCDQSVGPPDLETLLTDWGAAKSPADLNYDGTVNPADLALLLGVWTTK